MKLRQWLEENKIDTCENGEFTLGENNYYFIYDNDNNTINSTYLFKYNCDPKEEKYLDWEIVSITDKIIIKKLESEIISKPRRHNIDYTHLYNLPPLKLSKTDILITDINYLIKQQANKLTITELKKSLLNHLILEFKEIDNEQ